MGGAILHRFVPLDVPHWVARFLDHWRPDAGAFVESELWPNLLMGCQARHIPLLLLNARMSSGSLARWNRAPRTARSLLSAFRHVQARSTEDADRFRALGAGSVSAPGDLKFAAAALPADPAEVGRLACPGPVWLAASVHPEEAAIIAGAHRILRERYSNLLTIIAPRHPDRAGVFASDPNHTRRSAGQAPPPGGGIWLIDTLGELGLCYRLARIVLVGGSLFPHGGHNVLEPARLGCALATGPYTSNFAVACGALEQAGALARVSDAATVAHWVGAMLSNPRHSAQLGAAAQSVASQWGDLPRQSAAALLTLMSA
jgi:3-deoxy-D-manno-octulosonic-acid transferase